jgi:hypothetical protein
MRLATAHLFAFALLLCACVQASPPRVVSPKKVVLDEATIVQNDVRTVLNAGFQNDVDTMLRYTHPQVIVGLGGPEKARETFQKMLREVGQNGMKLESLSFPSPPTFLRSAQRRFVLVPTASIIEFGARRVEDLGYQLGILEPGSTEWTFVDGARISKDNARILFPDFPLDIELPKTYRKDLDRERGSLQRR